MAAGATGSYTLRRFGPRRMVGCGFVLTASSVLVLTAMGQHDRPALLTTAFVLLGFGLQTTLFGAYESMLSDVPPERAGGAAAIGETSYQLGAGLGIALLGSVIERRLRPRPRLPRRQGRPGPRPGPRPPTRWVRPTRSPRSSAALMGDLLRTTARHAFIDGLTSRSSSAPGSCCSGRWPSLRLPKAMECPPKEPCRRSEAEPAERPEPADAAQAPQAAEAVQSRRAEPPGPAPDAARAPRAGRGGGLWTSGTLTRNVSTTP